MRAVTAQSGSTLRTYDYEPFGSTRAQTGTQENYHKFAGEYEDPTGLYHLRARFYDPVSGRFLHPDPIRLRAGAAYESPYSYVASKPIRLVDPSGETAQPLRASRMAQVAASLAGLPAGSAAVPIGSCTWIAPAPGRGVTSAVASEIVRRLGGGPLIEANLTVFCYGPIIVTKIIGGIYSNQRLLDTLGAGRGPPTFTVLFYGNSRIYQVNAYAACRAGRHTYQAVWGIFATSPFPYLRDAATGRIYPGFRTVVPALSFFGRVNC